MSDSNDLVVVYVTNDNLRAELIRAALDGEGITAALENENQAGLTGVLPVRVLVRRADETVARAFIDEHEQHHAS